MQWQVIVLNMVYAVAGVVLNQPSKQRPRSARMRIHMGFGSGLSCFFLAGLIMCSRSQASHSGAGLLEASPAEPQIGASPEPVAGANPRPATATKGSIPQSNKDRTDACGLLTSKEIEAVQGESPKER